MRILPFLLSAVFIVTSCASRQDREFAAIRRKLPAYPYNPSDPYGHDPAERAARARAFLAASAAANAASQSAGMAYRPPTVPSYTPPPNAVVVPQSSVTYGSRARLGTERCFRKLVIK